MCKFADQDSPGYQSVLAAILKVSAENDARPNESVRVPPCEIVVSNVGAVSWYEHRQQQLGRGQEPSTWRSNHPRRYELQLRSDGGSPIVGERNCQGWRPLT